MSVEITNIYVVLKTLRSFHIPSLIEFSLYDNSVMVFIPSLQMRKLRLCENKYFFFF